MTYGAHALVFGASGLAGWGVVDQLLRNYPTKGTFSRVTALVNRPFSVADSYWSTLEAPQLDLVTNINLLDGSNESFTTLLKLKVPEIATVTHVFYFAFKADDKPDVETQVNRAMLERAIMALELLSPDLRFIAFPSGTRSYGIAIPGGVYAAPFTESLPRLPSPEGDNMFHYALQDVLTEQCKGKSWTWCDVRPDAIVGFVPNGNAFNLTAHWASYLSLYALVEGKGSKVPFPGTEEAFSSKFNEASSEMIAKLAIWASLHPEKAGCGQTFNVADQAAPSTMRERWPVLAGYFGLDGVGPAASPVLLPGEYIKAHQDVLNKAGIKRNEVFKAEFLDTYGYYLNFDRHLSLEKARSAGFLEEIDPAASWFKAFDLFRKAGMTP